jgi:predicted transcriptional regulator
MSIKPEYLYKILNGSKTIELRKTKPKIKQGDLLIFYASSPSKALSGAALVKGIIEDTPANLWKCYSDKVGIDINSYDSYFSKCTKAYGIILDCVWEYDPVPLDELRDTITGFFPPQSYRYLSLGDFKLLQKHIKTKNKIKDERAQRIKNNKKCGLPTTYNSSKF